MQRDHGTALLFITHDLRLAAHVCDEILVLYAGDMVERGPARAVMQPRAIPTRARCRPRTRRSPARCAARIAARPDARASARSPSCPAAASRRAAPSADRACASASAALGRSRRPRRARALRGCLEGAARVIEAAPLPIRCTASRAIRADAEPGVETLSRRTRLARPPAARHGRGRGPWTSPCAAGEFVGIVGECGSRQEHRRQAGHGAGAPDRRAASPSTARMSASTTRPRAASGSARCRWCSRTHNPP